MSNGKTNSYQSFEITSHVVFEKNEEISKLIQSIEKLRKNTYANIELPNLDVLDNLSEYLKKYQMTNDIDTNLYKELIPFAQRAKSLLREAYHDFFSLEPNSAATTFEEIKTRCLKPAQVILQICYDVLEKPNEIPKFLTEQLKENSILAQHRGWDGGLHTWIKKRLLIIIDAIKNLSTSAAQKNDSSEKYQHADKPESYQRALRIKEAVDKIKKTAERSKNTPEKSELPVRLV